MNSKPLASTLLAASLIAAPAVVFAQTSAPPDNTGPSGAGVTQPAPRAMHHSMSSHHVRHGSTVGMSSRSAGRARPGGQSVARKPPGS